MARIGLFALLLLTVTSAPALAADAARDAACRLDRVREILLGADAAGLGPGEADALILDNTFGWIADYNRFAGGDAAGALRARVDALPERPSRSQCRALLPFAAVSASAARVSAAGGAVAAGAVLVPCETGEGLCVPPGVTSLLEHCRIRLFTLPWKASC